MPGATPRPPRPGVLALMLLLPGAAAAAPELAVVDVDATSLGWVDLAGRAVGPVRATVRNSGDAAASSFVVAFFEDRDGDQVLDAGDLWLGSAAAGPLAAGAEATVAVAIDAALEFRHAPIHVLADSGDQVAEGDEHDNIGHSGRRCAAVRPAGPLDAQVEWAWPGAAPDSFANFANVMTAPAVVDLDGDRVPEVVFPATASAAGSLLLPGILRALRGRDGTTRFQVTHPSLRVNATSSVAVGDLDLDGRPEIVAADSTGTALLCFEHDGAFKWRSPPLEAIGWGAPALADLDGDGVPEIVIGRQVLTATGGIRWTGTGGRGTQGVGPLAAVADVDGDGSPDVVAGNTVYHAGGSIQATNAAIPDGLIGVADLDGDPFAEIVHVAAGQVRVLEHTLAVRHGPAAVAGTSTGGPPAIADFDGDGQAEIAVAGTSGLRVFEPDLTVRWTAPIQDLSSGRTGCTAFDLDGDGAAEVIARDEKHVWILRGTDGAALQQLPLGSCTFYEYALAADVDADGDAEIVAAANLNCSSLGNTAQGMRAYGSAGGRWVATRRVWNQYTYHLTEVAEGGSVPAIEPRHWLHPAAAPSNSFRRSALEGGVPARAAANLVASRLAVACAEGSHALSARIGNAGGVVAPPGIRVSFYHGDPGAGGALIGTASTAAPLEAGGWEDVTLAVSGAFAPTAPIHVVADDAGGLAGAEAECDETDNRLARSMLCPPLAAAQEPDGWAAALEPIRPNPVAGAARIAFALAEPGPARLVVLDAAGRSVRRLLDGGCAAGRRTVAWDGADDRGRRAPPGVYVVRLEAAGRAVERRLALIR